MINRLVFLCAVSICACSGDDDEPLKVTDNTVVAVIDGKSVKNEPSVAEYRTEHKQLAIVMPYDVGDQEYYLSVAASSNNIFVDLKPGEFAALGDDPPASPALVFLHLGAGVTYWSTSVEESEAGRVIITAFDLNTKLASGTFESKVQLGTEVKTVSGEFKNVIFSVQ